MQSWYKWGSAGQSMSHRHVKLALAPDSRLCELVLAIISSTPHDFAVMTAQTVALDETVASKPEIIEWWLQGAHNFPNPTWPDERLSMSYRATCISPHADNSGQSTNTSTSSHSLTGPPKMALLCCKLEAICRRGTGCMIVKHLKTFSAGKLVPNMSLSVSRSRYLATRKEGRMGCG